MSHWARVLDGVVQEPARDLPDGDEPAQYFPDHLPGTWEPAPDGTPQSGWTYAGGVYAAPVLPAPTLAQQAELMLMAGLVIASTGHPAVNATYASDPTAQQHIMAEVVALLDGAVFTDGSATISWLDKTGTPHTFDGPTFRDFARKQAAFVTGCVRCMTGQSMALPPASATIA